MLAGLTIQVLENVTFLIWQIRSMALTGKRSSQNRKYSDNTPSHFRGPYFHCFENVGLVEEERKSVHFTTSIQGASEERFYSLVTKAERELGCVGRDD